MSSSQPDSLEDAYANKREDYYTLARPDMMAFLPSKCRRVLEVGCGSGAFGRQIKTSKSCEVWGVEPEKRAAQLAEAQLDQVYNAFFSEELDLPPAHFDCIVFNDVLEHIFDPGRALAYARRLLTSDGMIVASIPNIRHFPTLWRLVIQGEWEYTDSGILDRTHLRFFTRASIRRLFESSGFSLRTLTGINAGSSMTVDDPRLWKYFRILSLIPSPTLRDMGYLQFAVQATPA